MIYRVLGMVYEVFVRNWWTSPFTTEADSVMMWLYNKEHDEKDSNSVT